MKPKEKLIAVRESLKTVTDEAGAEAVILLEHFTEMTRAEILLSEVGLDEKTLSSIDAAVGRRLLREPLQYILGTWYFMGLPFTVTPAALIPRQDTETLAEEGKRLISGRGYRSLLDVCTGTGCIAVSLAKLTGICAEASDISPECAALARENAERNGVKLAVRTADLFDGAGKYDVVTANPPYIADADMEALQPEVRFEPRLALAGGKDGLELYRRIAKEAEPHINRGGALLLEVGYGEAETVAALFTGKKVRIIKDLNGIDRVVIIEYA